MIEKDNNDRTQVIGFSGVKNFINDYRYIKTIVNCFVPQKLTDFQKAERVRIYQQNRKLLNNGGF